MTELEKDHSEAEELFEHYAFTADPKQELMRIDRWLMHKIANASRTKIQAGISAGCVLVNEKTVNYRENEKKGEDAIYHKLVCYGFIIVFKLVMHIGQII